LSFGVIKPNIIQAITVAMCPIKYTDVINFQHELHDNNIKDSKG
jgi:hypothetical protein